MAEIRPENLFGFGTEQVVRLTGLSKRQLGHWAATAFFVPEVCADRYLGPIYSFRDVVGLRVLSILRNEHGIPLQQLRRAHEYLKQHHNTPWASLKLGVAGRTVVFWDRDGIPTSTRPQKQMMMLDIAEVANDIRDRVAALRRRSTDDIGKTSKRRSVMHNTEVVAGTRIPAAAIIEYRDAGFSDAQILHEFPSLKRGDIRAVMEASKKHRTA